MVGVVDGVLRLDSRDNIVVLFCFHFNGQSLYYVNALDNVCMLPSFIILMLWTSMLFMYEICFAVVFSSNNLFGDISIYY